MSSAKTTWLTLGNSLWFAAYLLTMAGVGGGLNWARESSLVNMSSPEAQAQWNDFRDEMERESKKLSAPVARRAPESVEPPTLRLLRDYFGTTLALALVLCSLLFGTIMVMVRGVVTGERFTPRAD